MNYQIEIQRSNVTLAEFINYVSKRCKEKNIEFSITKEQLENPSLLWNISYYVKDGKKICRNDGYETIFDGSDAPCKSEILKIKPLEYQTYILNFDKSFYNEICEFNYYDEKRGFGYYFQANGDPK